MKIAIVEPIGITAEKLEQIRNQFTVLGHKIEFYADRNENEQELIKRVGNADVMVVSNILVTKTLIGACPNLSMISVAFTGVDHIDLQACSDRNILVSNAQGFSTEAVAELTIGMILDLYRKMSAGDKTIRKGGDRAGFLGTELNGKVVGIIGAGEIGLRVANIAMAFGCKVLAYSRTIKDIPNITFVDKATLLQQADIVSLHTPLTEATKYLIGEKELQLMKKSAILINTARGLVVDNKALCSALQNGEIAGAAIDVYEKEPPLAIDYPLFAAPNTLLLPHFAYATSESFNKRIDIVMENIVLWLQGKPRNIMNEIMC